MAIDLRPQHRAAIVQATEWVRLVTPEDLGRGTPCSDWTMSDLLAHMIGQHRGFADAAASGDAHADAYAPTAFTPAAWEASVAALLSAFERTNLQGEVVLRELAPGPLPMRFAVSAQLLDTVVHTWDIARGLGRDYEPTEDVAATVERIAQAVPDGERRTTAGAAFAPALEPAGSAWDRALALLGRDPRTGDHRSA